MFVLDNDLQIDESSPASGDFSQTFVEFVPAGLGCAALVWANNSKLHVRTAEFQKGV
jgi:hypothetical protein